MCCKKSNSLIQPFLQPITGAHRRFVSTSSNTNMVLIGDRSIRIFYWAFESCVSITANTVRNRDEAALSRPIGQRSTTSADGFFTARSLTSLPILRFMEVFLVSFFATHNAKEGTVLDVEKSFLQVLKK